MNIDVKVELAEVLDSYEITNLGILSVAKKGTKSVEAIGSPKNYTDKGIADDDDEFPEGKELTELHKRKERNPKVVLRKKKKVLQERGKLECEVCGFDFVKIYGQLGYGFSECHHTVPVSELTEGHKTKLSDMVIVCANCHRMLHKSRPLISIGELRAVVKYNADK
jgi:5-methylcytosine-specific restriction protein A